MGPDSHDDANQILHFICLLESCLFCRSQERATRPRQIKYNAQILKFDCHGLQAFINKVHCESKPLFFEKKCLHNEIRFNATLGLGVVEMFYFPQLAIKVG